MPFKEDLDRTPIDVLADKYGGGGAATRAFQSVISTQISVPTAAATLEEMLEAVETVVIDEDTGETPDGNRWLFSGVIAPHPEMRLKPSTIEFTTAALTVNDDGNGNLAAAGVTGTIDYDTGAWTISCDVAPAAGPNWAVDYTWFYGLPAKVNGLWLVPAGEIRATFSPDATPTAATGVTIDADAVFDLLGQATLIQNAKFIAGGATAVQIEVMV